MSSENNNEENVIVRDILGYLNFSSGNHEPRFFKAWNSLYSILEQSGCQSIWLEARRKLTDELLLLKQNSDAFKNSERAGWILQIVYDKILPSFREFHKDVLYHQKDEFLFNPFFLARVCELTLAKISTEDYDGKDESFILNIIIELNDFIGYRPIPVLEGEEKHEPNPHEWIAPLSLYREDAGVACGPYRQLITQTLEILRTTDPSLLHDAWFDPDKIREIVMDPRAYDFDHPVNRRPNYSFGTWDPHCIDEDGYYRRFVIHQVTVDGILGRVKEGISENKPSEKIAILSLEAAAVLAGTMLMGSGISGDHVQAHDSTVSLITLMPLIADYRDRFYELLIQKVPESMKITLQEEAKRLFQPFGGARQSLNKYLAKQRADQLQRFNLARTFARMGYFDAALKQTQIIIVTSARFLCQIDCHVTEGHLLADKGEYIKAAELLPSIEDLLYRGIDCGALADPWSLLGFGAQYSLFPAVDNSIHDHRIDDLIGIMNDIFDLYSRLEKECAVHGNSELQADLSDRMSTLAGWWDQFGSTEVSDVEGFSGQDVWESAAKVSNALAVWYKAGNATGDVAFWQRHVERFNSPKAFVLLCEALLEQNDLVSSMALMMHWLSDSDRIALQEGNYSFHTILFRWVQQLSGESMVLTDNFKLRNNRTIAKSNLSTTVSKKKIMSNGEILDSNQRWELMIKLLDRLEANADKYWAVPTLDIDPGLLEKKVSTPSKTASPNITINFSVTGVPFAQGHELVIDNYLQSKILRLKDLALFIIFYRAKFHKLYNLTKIHECFQRLFNEIPQQFPFDEGISWDYALEVFNTWITFIDKIESALENRTIDLQIPNINENLFITILYSNILDMESNSLDSSDGGDNNKIDSDDKFDNNKTNNEDDNDNVTLQINREIDQIHDILASLVSGKTLSPLKLLLEILHPGIFSKSPSNSDKSNSDNSNSKTNNNDTDPKIYTDDDYDAFFVLLNKKIKSTNSTFEQDNFIDFLTQLEEDENLNGYDDFYDEDDDIEDDIEDDIDNNEDNNNEDDNNEDDKGDNETYIENNYNKEDNFNIFQSFNIDNALNDKNENDSEDDDNSDNDNSDDNNSDDDDNDDDDMMGIDPTFKAAYDNMTFQDSAEDGNDGEMMDGNSGYIDGDDSELNLEMERINDRLIFIYTLVKLWKYVAGKSFALLKKGNLSNEICQHLENWLKQAYTYQDDLESLLDQTFRYRVPKPSGTAESLMEYDQHLGTKEILLDRIIWTTVEVSDSILFMESILLAKETGKAPEKDPTPKKDITETILDNILKRYSKNKRRKQILNVFSAILSGDVSKIRKQWKVLLFQLKSQTLLYIPTSRGGKPEKIVTCRCLQQIVLRLLEYLPRLGLIKETFELLRTVQCMEGIRPSMPGAITEFDRLFETATRSLAKSIAESSKRWRLRIDDSTLKSIPEAQVHFAEKTVDILVNCWLSHSQHIRISSVETLSTFSIWEGIKKFIITYGKDLLTQQFLAFRNLRAILHQGVASWLHSLIHLKEKNETLEVAEHLIDDITNGKYNISQAIQYLEWIFECIAENYAEYIDYNSTTTHSDHGEKTYMFLDMLRVLISYERISWNLKPVYWIHDALIRAKCFDAAVLWEKSVAKKSASISEENIKNYMELSEKYGMWLPSIYERLQERLVRPLQIAQMCGLVGEAIEDVRSEKPKTAFKRLEEQVEQFAQAPMGTGFELPEWLNTLQDEVLDYQSKTGHADNLEQLENILNPQIVCDIICLSRSDIEKQLTYCKNNIDFKE